MEHDRTMLAVRMSFCDSPQGRCDFLRAPIARFEVAFLRLSHPTSSASEPWAACGPPAGASRVYMGYGTIDWQRIGSKNGVPALRLSYPVGCPILKHCAAAPNHENLWSHAAGADTLYLVSTTRYPARSIPDNFRIRHP